MKRTLMTRSNQASWRRKGIGLVAAALALVLTACAGGGQSTSKPADGKNRTLNLWYGSEPGQKDAVVEIVGKWAKANGVTVNITAMGPDLNPPALLPALSAGEGPDLWAGATGPGPVQTLIRNGVIKDLKSYYCKYEWGSTLPDDLAALVSSASGELWAVPNSIESSGMFYRKSIFKKLGIQVPTTWNDLVVAVQKLKAAGYSTPIGAAGQDAWSVTHLTGAMWGAAAGPKIVQESIAGTMPWNSPVYLKATEAFADLVRAGAFGKQANAYTYQAMTADFYTGKVPMTYTGSFMISDAIEAAGENFADIGVFALPNVLGGPIVANYGPGEGWYVNAKSKNVDLAAQLLNHLFFTEASRKKLVEGGLLPNGAIDLSKVEVPSALAELLAEMNKYQKNGVVPTYLEGAAFDVLIAEVQKVLAGKATAKQLVDTVEKASIVAAAKAGAYVPGIAPKC